MFKSPIQTKLEAEITAALNALPADKKSEEYGTAIDRVAKLHKLKTDEKNGIRPASVDTMLIVGANIFGILWLARYEQEHVVKARTALGFVMKPR